MSKSDRTLTKVLRRASDALDGTRWHLAEELSAFAERIEKLRSEAKERCGDFHRMGCPCVVLAAIDEPIDAAS
jgi:hypothetical protein